MLADGTDEVREDLDVLLVDVFGEVFLADEYTVAELAADVAMRHLLVQHDGLRAPERQLTVPAAVPEKKFQRKVVPRANTVVSCSDAHVQDAHEQLAYFLIPRPQ